MHFGIHTRTHTHARAHTHAHTRACMDVVIINEETVHGFERSRRGTWEGDWREERERVNDVIVISKIKAINKR